MDKLDIKDLNKVNGGAMSEEEIKRMMDSSYREREKLILGEGFEDPKKTADRILQEAYDKIKQDHDRELQKVQDPFGLNRRDTM